MASNLTTVLHWLDVETVNRFIEDTCVLAAIAYTLGRSRLLGFLYEAHKSRRQQLMVGLLFGIVASSEAFFPNDRAPYVTSSLLISLAMVFGGELTSASAAVLALAAFATVGLYSSILPTSACAAVVAATGLLAEPLRSRLSVFGVIVAASGQGVSVAASYFEHGPFLLASISANAFGMFVVLLILNDAKIRSQSMANEIEVHRLQTLMADAQLQDLKARVNPHFMFNALTSIAGLCRIAPQRAERAVITLASVMRNALDLPASKTIPLSVELARVESYLEIESLRHGEKLMICLEVAEAGRQAKVPPFALQTLVENAIIHGTSKSNKAVSVLIAIKETRGKTFVFVKDNGSGFTPKRRSGEERPTRGLDITNQRLIQMCGKTSRLRLFSAPGKGTLAAFRIENHG